MWVFVNKADKHGFLQKCKAWLVVCGNQQARGDLFHKSNYTRKHGSLDPEGGHGEV
jgi:hypothetical protein